MKVKRTFFGLVLAGMLTIMAQPSVLLADEYSGAWLPNARFMVGIDLTLGNNEGNVYMYDWKTENSALLLQDNIFSGSVVNFKYDDDDDNWKAIITRACWGDDPPFSSSTLELGPTKDFGFYFEDSDGHQHYDYDITKWPSELNIYTVVDDNTSMKVLVAFAAPVPLPASILFLGSGVVGLIAFSRVRRNS